MFCTQMVKVSTQIEICDWQRNERKNFARRWSRSAIKSRSVIGNGRQELLRSFIESFPSSFYSNDKVCQFIIQTVCPRVRTVHSITAQVIRQCFRPILRRASCLCEILGVLSEFAADGPMVLSAWNKLWLRALTVKWSISVQIVC